MATRKTVAKSKSPRTRRTAEKSGKSRGPRPIGKSARLHENRADLWEKPRTQADRHEAPVDTEIKRAAARAGIHVHTVEREVERRADEAANIRLAKALAPDLVLASEYISEELANIENAGGGDGYDNALLLSALHKIWQIRWNLGLYTGSKHLTDGAS
jgi:hypothetical protein